VDLIPYSAVTAADSVFWNMNFGPPDVGEKITLLTFLPPQYAYGQQIGVMDPGLFAYEALGAALADSSVRFQGVYGNSRILIGPDGGRQLINEASFANTPAGDAGFVNKAYAEIFGHAPEGAQAQHFLDQLHFLQGIYTASGAYGPADHIDLVARGAVFGQMIGIQNELVQFVGVSEIGRPGIGDPHTGVLV
jgi:hypothetical protein